MTVRIGDVAPNFKVNTTQGEIDFHEWIGDEWVFFFSHPADYTPICTTEMGRTAQLADEFAKRGTKPLGLSTDSIEDHNGWIKDINTSQKTSLGFPIVADTDKSIAQAYGMIHPGESTTAAVRSVFIIDPNKKIRLTLTYPMNIGRNFDEILRVIDALQFADKNGVATPADWKVGDRVVIPPSLSDEEATIKFPQGFEAVTPYLRFTEVK